MSSRFPTAKEETRDRKPYRSALAQICQEGQGPEESIGTMLVWLLDKGDLDPAALRSCFDPVFERIDILPKRPPRKVAKVTCPECDGISQVRDSRKRGTIRRRKRRCQECDHVFGTYQIDGEDEKIGTYRATTKTPGRKKKPAVSHGRWLDFSWGKPPHLPCLGCGGSSRVCRSRTWKGLRRRKRQCRDCGEFFWTYQNKGEIEEYGHVDRRVRKNCVVCGDVVATDEDAEDGGGETYHAACVPRSDTEHT